MKSSIVGWRALALVEVGRSVWTLGIPDCFGNPLQAGPLCSKLVKTALTTSLTIALATALATA
jgi:hypothetical protein